MKITILYSDNNPSDYHRLLLPAKYMDNIRLVKQESCDKDESVFDCDILMFSRIFMFDWEALKLLRKKYGFKIIVDFDDYYKLCPQQLRYKLWLEHNIASRMIEAAKNADLLFVTNEQLYKVYREFNPNVLIIPNALPFDSEEAPIKEASDKVKFIYVAGKSHYNDLKLLRGLFQRLYSDGHFKDQAKFIFCGYDGTNESIKMEYLCKGMARYYERRNLLPLKTYMEHYKEGDVSIAPLENNLYNNSKSNLKFIESALNAMPFICSEVLPYTQDLRLKDDGIKFCSKTSEWYDAFKFFIRNPNAIDYFGMRNYEYAMKYYNLKDANELRMEAFSLNQCPSS